MAAFEMSLKLFNKERRSSLENPQTPLSFPAEWLLDIFNGGRTDSGIRVSELTALQVSTVLACVNIISNGVAALPLKVYERIIKAGRLSKKLALEHNLFDLLDCEPNEEMTSFTWRKTLQAHALLWGNLYCEIERNGKNEIINLWPRNPARTRPIRFTAPATIEGTTYPTGTMAYETNETKGDSQMAAQDGTEALDNKMAIRRIVLSEDMIHIPGLSLDGRLGQSTVWLTRQTIGLALATEKYGAKFFGNNARPAGVLEVPGTMEPIAVENLKRSWAEAHGGENSHKTALLEAGVKYTKIGATPEEGQYLQTRQYVRQEIATIFQVPGHMVGETDKGKNTTEQAGIEFVLYCLGPWLTSWEQELKRKLMPKLGPTVGKYFVKFDTRRLLYPDAESRSKFYATGRQWGFLNGDDIRELEDMDPIGGKAGSSYWMPANMIDAGDIDQIVPPGATDPNAPKPAPPAPAPGAQQAKPGTPDVPPASGKGKPAAKPKAGKKKPRSLTFGAGGGIDPNIDGPFVMRHGTTGFNEKDIYREWTAEDLDERGLESVAANCLSLRDRGISKIVSTPLQRGKTTAKIVAATLGGIPVEYDENLNTWKHGFGGQSKAEAGDKVRYYIENPDEVPDNGESLNAFIKRNQEAKNKYAGAPGANGTLLISSGSNISDWSTGAQDAVSDALSNHCELGPSGVGVFVEKELHVIMSGDKFDSAS